MRDRDKQSHEVDVFVGFISAAQLPIEACSVKNGRPPYPDIQCIKNHNSVCLFELAEILWEDPDAEIKGLAHGFAISKRASEKKAGLLAAGRVEEAQQIQTWGEFGHAPLASLQQVLEKKCAKRYKIDDHPLSLLLYYERESPFEPFDLLADQRKPICSLLATSQFSDVWLYHHAVGYTSILPDLQNGGVVSVPLRNMATPESQRRAIGHLAMTAAGLTISLDAFYSQEYNRASAALTATRERYNTVSDQNSKRDPD